MRNNSQYISLSTKLRNRGIYNDRVARSRSKTRPEETRGGSCAVPRARWLILRAVVQCVRKLRLNTSPRTDTTGPQVQHLHKAHVFNSVESLREDVGYHLFGGNVVY